MVAQIRNLNLPFVIVKLKIIFNKSLEMDSITGRILFPDDDVFLDNAENISDDELLTRFESIEEGSLQFVRLNNRQNIKRCALSIKQNNKLRLIFNDGGVEDMIINKDSIRELSFQNPQNNIILSIPVLPPDTSSLQFGMRTESQNRFKILIISSNKESASITIETTSSNIFISSKGMQIDREETITTSQKICRTIIIIEGTKLQIQLIRNNEKTSIIKYDISKFLDKAIIDNFSNTKSKSIQTGTEKTVETLSKNLTSAYKEGKNIQFNMLKQQNFYFSFSFSLFRFF